MARVLIGALCQWAGHLFFGDLEYYCDLITFLSFWWMSSFLWVGVRCINISYHIISTVVNILHHIGDWQVLWTDGTEFIGFSGILLVVRLQTTTMESGLHRQGL